MQYVVTAYDFTDEACIERRLANREAHLKGLQTMSEAGTFLSGGAILDKQGKMIGSSAHVEFSTRSELQHWLDTDPYTVGKVWNTIEVKEIKLFKPT